MEINEVETKGKFDEKRTFRRFLANLEVTLEFNIEGESFKEGNYLIDICVGGLAFMTRQELKKGDEILMRIPAGKYCFEGYGEVMWTTGTVNSYQVGIEFIKMTGASIDGVHRLLEKVRLGDLAE